MKRTILISFAFIGLCLCSFSQEKGISTNAWGPSDGALLDGKTLVKVNITGLALRNFSFATERVLNKHISLVAGIGFIPNGGIPYASTISKLANDSSGFINNVQMNAFSSTLEMRIYTGAGYGKGFYIAPYYRFEKYNFDKIKFDYETNGSPQTVLLNGKLSSNSGGILIGYQWLIGKSKNFVLDWSILGLHYGGSKGSVFGETTQNMTAQEQQDLKDGIDGNLGNIPMIKHTTTVTSNTVNIDINGPWAFIRSGVSFGFRF